MALTKKRKTKRTIKKSSMKLYDVGIWDNKADQGVRFFVVAKNAQQATLLLKKYIIRYYGRPTRGRYSLDIDTNLTRPTTKKVPRVYTR